MVLRATLPYCLHEQRTPAIHYIRTTFRISIHLCLVQIMRLYHTQCVCGKRRQTAMIGHNLRLYTHTHIDNINLSNVLKSHCVCVCAFDASRYGSLVAIVYDAYSISH